jgi:uncharacterized protein YggT (Ycf19 family)
MMIEELMIMAQTHVANQRVVTHRSQYSGGTLWVRLIYWISGAIEIVLLFRFVLRLFGANPNAGFVQFVYQLAAPLMAPFTAVFGNTKIEGAVFEWSVLLAVAVYALIAWGLATLIERVAPTSGKSVEQVEEVREHEQTPPNA